MGVEAEFDPVIHPEDEVFDLTLDELAESAAIIGGVADVELFLELTDEGDPSVVREAEAAVLIDCGERGGDGTFVEKPDGKPVQAGAVWLHEVVDQ